MNYVLPVFNSVEKCIQLYIGAYYATIKCKYHLIKIAVYTMTTGLAPMYNYIVQLFV